MLTFKEFLADKKINSVDFGYAKYKIMFTKNLHEGEDSCWGVSDFDAYEIRLDSSIPYDIGKEVLLHEIMHGVINLVGFGGYNENHKGVAVGDGYVPDTTNEFLTDAVTKGMLLVMRLNKKLFLEIING